MRGWEIKMWQHNYSILGDNIFLTAIVAAIPIFFLFWALAVKRMKGYKAGVFTLLIAIIVAIVLYKMPVGVAISSAFLGIANGLFPLGWIVIAAVFLFNLVVESGKFEVIKTSISSISPDRRIQALLIAFCFSAFIEGVAGQGAPVAVAAAMLIGLGFKPMTAALVCLVANVPPVPFGPVGVPTITTAKVAEVALAPLAQAIGREMIIFSVIIPIFMLVVMVGWKKTKEVLPAAFVAGGSFGLMFFVISNFVGAELTSILSSITSLVVLVGFLKVWKPKTIWRFEHDAQVDMAKETKYSGGEIFRAWSPFLIVMIVMGIWGSTPFKSLVANDLKWFINIKEWPGLHGLVYRVAPIVKAPAVYAASYKLDYFGAAGTALLISSIISLFIIKVNFATAVKVFGKTCKQLVYSVITIASVIGFAYVANYSGMSYSYGLAFAATGGLFIVFSPVIGGMGTFLTGSVTSSGSLFGKLQAVSAQQIGINPILTVSANLLGACMGKLISPQSIAVAAASAGLVGKESEIFRSTFKYFLILLGMVVVAILIFAYLIPGIIPTV
jgi:L-lactate transport